MTLWPNQEVHTRRKDLEAPPLFYLLDGFRFYGPRDEPVGLYAGMYSNGRGAFRLVAGSGEPYDNLTVNLCEEECAEDEFFVRSRHEQWESDTKDVSRKLLSFGLFEQVGSPVSQGFVKLYAERWRFSKMNHPHTEYRVQMPHIMAGLEAARKAQEEELLIRDAERRLSTRPRTPAGYYADTRDVFSDFGDLELRVMAAQGQKKKP
jgi:hypothetical protein